MSAIRLEEQGLPRDAVMRMLEETRHGDADWRGGRVPLYVFGAPPDVTEIGQAAFNAFFSENALGARRAFPSLARMEREVIGMGLDLFHASPDAVGNMTSGGTESIVMAVKAARDHARRHRGQPHLRGNLVLPLSAHPAFDKAAALMDIEVRRIALTGALVADVAAMDAAADGETLMLVGSVPCFPYGTIDPIPALAELAQRRGIWLHVDACVGGWLAPFAADLGRPIPRFDFALPGVCSLSADLHKFGFCPKPASTIFYASAELAAFQRLEFDTWPSGRFGTDTLVGTRPGGAVAGAWAVLRYLGRAGYRRIAADLLAIRDAYVEGMLAIEGMHMRGDPPLMNLAFGCEDVDMAKIATLLSARGWVPGQLRTPPSLHLMLSLHHGPARAAYVADVAACVAELRGGQNATRSEAHYA